MRRRGLRRWRTRSVAPSRTSALLLLLLLPLAAGGPVSAQVVPVPQPSAPARQQVVIPSTGEEEDSRIDLPAYPSDRDLIELQQVMRPDLKLHVDARSVQVSPSGDIRYTLVVRTATGSRNVTHEVMRCPERERMILATGTVDRSWSPARFLRWESLERNDILGQRSALHTYVFCPARFPVADAKEAVAALRAGMHPRAIPK